MYIMQKIVKIDPTVWSAISQLYIRTQTTEHLFSLFLSKRISLARPIVSLQTAVNSVLTGTKTMTISLNSSVKIIHNTLSYCLLLVYGRNAINTKHRVLSPWWAIFIISWRRAGVCWNSSSFIRRFVRVSDYCNGFKTSPTLLEPLWWYITSLSQIPPI